MGSVRFSFPMASIAKSAVSNAVKQSVVLSMREPLEVNKRSCHSLWLLKNRGRFPGPKRSLCWSPDSGVTPINQSIRPPFEMFTTIYIDQELKKLVELNAFARYPVVV